MPKGVYERPSRENKREEILKAATKVYAHYGFEGATIERMAKEAGVSNALILNYYGSKQGIVKAIADRAVRENLDKIKRIDETYGLTLREREQLVHEIMAPAREEWCLILGTLLVPNFQFQQRGEMGDYLNISHKTVLERHLHEFREATPETALAYTYSMISIHIGYIVGGREKDFQLAKDRLLDLYLHPKEILELKEENG